MALNKNDVMLLDIQYVRASKQKQLPDYLYIVWKEISTGKKHLISIPEPTVDIYFEKPEYRDFDYNKNYEYLNKLDKKTVKYSKIPHCIAADAGPDAQRFLSQIFSSGDFKRIQELNLYPYVFGSDYDIRALYRIEWLKKYDNNNAKPITKGFLDIEADSITIEGFADPKQDCPCDLVTFIDYTSKTSYTFCLIGREYTGKTDTVKSLLSEENRLALENKEKELQSLFKERRRQETELMNDVDGLKEELHSLFDDVYGHLDYKFYFFNDEAKLIVSLFQLINQLKLDFIEIWNLSFDIPYMMKRLMYLNYDPLDVMANKDFANPECWFKEDKHNVLPKNKWDNFSLSSYTKFVDQMQIYAAVRKGAKELRSLKLTNIARDEIKDEKLDYSEEGNIKTLPYRNYRKYIIYNIKDVLLQLGIERKTSDLETFYITSYANATPYEQVFKQTLKLRNAQYISYLNQSIIPRNNVNINMDDNIIMSSEDEDESEEGSDTVRFEGALVGNPNLIDNFGVVVYGSKSNAIFAFSVDFDMSAFYPNTIYTNNIDPSTLYFKVIIPADEFESRGGKYPYHGITDVQVFPENSDSFTGDIAKEVFDNFGTRNYLSVGRKWNNLPNIRDVYKECLDRLGKE